MDRTESNGGNGRVTSGPRAALVPQQLALAENEPKRHLTARRAVICGVLSLGVLAIAAHRVFDTVGGTSAPLQCFNGSGIAAVRACDEVIAGGGWSQAVRAEAQYNRGIELDRLRRPAEALLAYEEAVRLKPDYAAAYTNMGLTLLELERRDDAVRAYRRAIAANPRYADAHYNLGIVLLDLQRREEALEAFREAVRLDPGDAQALYNTGVTLNLLRRHDEALQVYVAAVTAKPRYAEAWGNLGLTAYLLGRDTEAFDAFEQALRLQPSYFETHEIQRNAWEDVARTRSTRPGRRAGGHMNRTFV